MRRRTRIPFFFALMISPDQSSEPVPMIEFRDDTAQPSPHESWADAAAREESHLRLYYAGLAYFLSGFGEKSETTTGETP
jgi:hypothetical protein